MKQCQNAIRKIVKKKQDLEGKSSKSKNYAEECYVAQQLVLPPPIGNKYVRRTMTNDENGYPNLILYSDDQLNFIKNHCGSNCKQQVILGVVSILTDYTS